MTPMNAIIDRIREYAKIKPNATVYAVYSKAVDNPENFSTDSLTWRQLDSYSDKLSQYIALNTTTNTPIVVYGHKSKFMMVCFIACVKSGHAYCPVDVSVPSSRVQDIINTVEPEMVLTTTDGSFLVSDGCKLLSSETIEEICVETNGEYHCDESLCLQPQDVFYIIFTSGSTGKPKGVQITTECLVNYVKWAQDLGTYDSAGNHAGGGTRQYRYRFLNQAPFSFDLSVMDVYLSLYTGGTLCAITKDVQKDLRLLFRVLPATDVNVWVSTPSFADVCLSDRSYNEALLPNLKLFLFCGEI